MDNKELEFELLTNKEDKRNKLITLTPKGKAYMNETDSTRLDSHDFRYSNGSYTYHDTYVGGEQFVGEEAIWYEGKSQYAMNYAGRVLET